MLELNQLQIPFSGVDVNVELQLHLEEMGYNLTNNDYEAIYVMQDGAMIDGECDCGYRGLDHNMIAFAVPYKRSIDYNKFWNYVHEELGLLRVIPETEICLAGVNQELTQEQLDFIERTGYELERY